MSIESCTPSVIFLPVSLGEAFDKLTILDIKLSNITDARKQRVDAEYSALYAKLKEFIDTYRSLYESTKKVNVLIWKLMDELRDGDLSDADYLITAKKMIDLNDVRFRIKNKINSITKSQYTEQKGYKINTLVIEFEDNIVVTADYVKPILYYSYIYDQIIIRAKDSALLRDTFCYDSTIRFVDQSWDAFDCKQTITVSENCTTPDEVADAFLLTLPVMNSIL